MTAASWADPDPTDNGPATTIDDTAVAQSAAADQEAASIVEAAADQPERVRRGWRYFLAGTDHGAHYLYPVFGFSRLTPFPDTWVQADCRPDQAPAHTVGLDLFDDREHVIPGEGCGCGWRIYPSIAAATAGARVWPERHAISLHQADVVLAAVDYSGKLAVPPAGAARTDDEAGTLRARWLRIVGPIYAAPRVGRPTRRALTRRYRAPVVKLDQGVFAAVADGFIENTDPTETG